MSIWITFAAMEVVPPTATAPLSNTSCPVAVSERFEPAPLSVSDDAASDATKPATVVALKEAPNVELPTKEILPDAASFNVMPNACGYAPVLAAKPTESPAAESEIVMLVNADEVFATLDVPKPATLPAVVPPLSRRHRSPCLR